MADIQDQNSHHVKMVRAMSEASNWIVAGRPKDASLHVKATQFHHDAHVAMLKDQGRHGEADAFIKQMKPYIKEMNHLYDRVSAGKPLSESTQKSEAGLEKAIPYNLGFNPNRNYKMFHELSNNEKMQAGNAYQNKDLHSHMYAFDKKTGEMNSSGRIPIPEKPTPDHPAYGKKAYYPKPEDTNSSPVKAHHMKDSFVRIHSPGSEMHGKPGIVQGYSAQEPGKVPVQMHIKGVISTHFFHPHEVIPGSKPKKSFGGG
jgi:hypothetical protein